MGLKTMIEAMGASDRLPNLSRRQWLKLAAATATGATVSGCATFPDTPREEVDKIEWDCNPILEIPDKGRKYIGTNQSGCYHASQSTVAKNFLRKYGKRPTFLAPGLGVWGAQDRQFPTNYVKESHDAGVIPMIRYMVTPGGYWYGFTPKKGYKIINSGRMDDDIKIFGAKAAELEKPIIVCPFQQPNDTESWFRPWGGPGTSGPFKEAYTRIHDIWQKEGALDKIVMGVKLLVGDWQYWQYPDPLSYIPPEDKVDIIGWVTNNMCQPHLYIESKSFEGIFERTYSRAVAKYPRKPQIIWELACDANCNQAAWLDRALTQIEEKYYWVKAVNLDECFSAHGAYRFSPEPVGPSVEVVKQHFLKPRYISNILPVKGILPKEDG